jgi:phosphoribosylanthranilate isomerase
VVASGGVSTIEDLLTLAALTDIGVEGAIIGTALYTGAFTLEDALAAVAESAGVRA